VLMYNIYSPRTNTYLNILSGLEMIEYYQMIEPHFNVTIFMAFKGGDIEIMLIYILFCISVILSCLKLIYVMNIKLNIVVHLCSLATEVINLGIMVFLTIR
jgi:hypothetical protein